MLRLIRLLPALALCSFLSGCLLPKGPSVVVDSRGGDSWSGDGVLIDQSDDGMRCRVALRGESLVFVERRWVPCKYVHEQSRPW